MPDAFQTTLAAPIHHLSGRGVHSGQECRLALLPAPPDTGIVFARTDLPDSPVIPAAVASVTEEALLRQTLLRAPEAPEVTVATVEHLLATFHAMGVDNVRVEMSAVECPIWDGSAAPVAEAVGETGTVEQPDAPRRIITVERPMSFSPPDSPDVEFAIWPSEGLTITYFLSQDHPMIGSQAVSMRIDADTYRTEVAPARTWCTFEEVEFLRSKGLIKGGTADNAIVIGQDKILNTELRWENELARHKLLDLLGDLFLLGAQLRGHVTAFRSGHHTNVQFARYLMEELAQP